MRSLTYPEKRRLRDAYKRRVRAEVDIDRLLVELNGDGVPYSELAACLEITKQAIPQRLAKIRARAAVGVDAGGEGSQSGGASASRDLTPGSASSEQRGPS